MLTDIVPDLDADLEPQRQAVQVWGKRYVAEDLKGQWKTTAETLTNIQLRIEPEKLERLVEKEPAYRAFKGFTAFEPTTWHETARGMLLPVWEALKVAARDGVVFMLMESVDKDLRGMVGESDEKGTSTS